MPAMEEVNRRESWKQGIRAVFAGFVASAHQRALPATIDIFWLTEQKDTILPSLRSLVGDLLPKRAGEGEGGLEKRVLYIILSDPENVLTRSKETDELERVVRWKEIKWELTSRGRKMFPVQMAKADKPGEGVAYGAP